ncbi:MAG TPA: prohibitin family protein [Anaerolineales bacterium]|nr:prohibitin family protein [Anaerolineales bacterium]
MTVADVVKVLASLSWLLVIGAIAFLVATAARRGGVGRVIPLVIGGGVLALVLTVASAGLVAVDEREIGVVRNPFQQQVEPKGLRPESMGAGLHWVVPFVETVTTYTISRQTYTMASVSTEGQVSGDDSIPARTKDGQQVQIDASVIYEIDPAKVIQLHIAWQGRYEEQVIRPVARSAIRDAVSQYGVEEIVSSKRAELEQAITDDIATKLAAQNLRLSDFLLRNITFSDEYAKAVEQKQIAEQLAQQAKFVVEQRKQEAEQARQVAEGQADAAVIAAEGAAKARLVQAEAEAKALDLIAAALKDNPDLIQYTYVQKLGANVQVMLVPSNSPYLFNLPQVPEATVAPEPAPAAPVPAPTTTP